jgi:uncharacterized protein YndB with AHSA1/START domain
MSEQDRVIDVSIEVPGSPEQVWEAIATGPGITSWFVPHEVDEHEGGTVRMDFGDFGSDTATVTAWEPPRRVVFQSGGERPMAYEWLVEARDGGTCVVRLVNSGFGPGEDWDDDFAGMSSGWRIFLENLRLHLTHFAGQRARALTPTRPVAGPLEDAFSRLCAALGVRDDLVAGDRFATSGDGVPTVTGTVQARHRFESTTTYFVLLDAPSPGTAFVSAEGAGGQVLVSAYLYLYGHPAPELEGAWRRFFADRFPAPEGEAAGVAS